MKKNLYSIIFILILSVGFTLSQAQNTGGFWYKGNTHTHSYWSDGDDFPEMVMEWYKNHGYNFVCLSDHNILAKGEKWKEISDDALRQARFREYLEKFGEQWVNYRMNSEGKIQVELATMEKYLPLFEEEGRFIMIQSEEISDKYQDKPIHLNVINNADLIRPSGGKSLY